MKVYPDNTVAHYFTLLSKPLVLHGNWEVAMSSIMYTRTWYDIYHQTLKYQFEEEGEEITVEIPELRSDNGNHKLMEALSDICDGVSWEFYEPTFKVRVTTNDRATGFKLKASESLSMMLGIRNYNQKRGTMPSGRQRLESVDPFVPLSTRELFVYTNIIEHQPVGDTSAPLLRVVTAATHFGDINNYNFTKLHYLPVNTNLINTIEIDIRDEFGYRIPFRGGRSNVKLHFRQKSLL